MKKILILGTNDNDKLITHKIGEKKQEHCDGSRYNFKKGFEFCPNKESCYLYKYFQTLEKPYENPRKRFYYIKDFRKCDEHKINK